MAVKNPSIVNPGTNCAATYKRKALIIKVNNPKVKRLIGSARNNRIGFTKTDNKPNTKTTIKAEVNELI